MPEAQDMTDLTRWAREHWPGGDPGPLQAEPVAADGSVRSFVRLGGGGRSLVALSNPDNPGENRAWHVLAGRLGALGLPVARVLAADLEAGRFLMEDLGSGSLMEAVLAAPDDKTVAMLYEPVLAMLARLQARGALGLDLSICFDGPELTPAFLLEQEAGYFLRELVLGAAGLESDELPPGLSDELAALCELAGRARPRGLVHRDFQSRNIVYDQGRYGLVDFQGARLGPAQYDLASLLHDPYVQLDWGLRDSLLERYLVLRDEEGPFDHEAFRAGWAPVSASRLMQALGAFSFLTRKRNRPHFAVSVGPALASLERIFKDPALAGFSGLAGLVGLLPGRLAPNSFDFLEELT
jgi:N-acetylmuramate 1-kinase